MPPTSNLALPEETIRTRAYHLWEADGRAHGRDDHYWREAIAQLQAESSQPSLSPSAEDDAGLGQEAQKPSKTGKSVAKKATKKTDEAADNAKVKGEKKGSKKAVTKVVVKAADIGEGKRAAKKSKVTKKDSEVSEGAATAPTAAPARPKKPRKA